MYDKLPEPKKLYEIDSEHDYRLHPEKIEEVNRVIEKFLEAYVPQET